MSKLETRMTWLSVRRPRRAARVTDRSPWDWYADSCSCGQPPGGCRVHPRGRPSQRPPAGDWRVWAYVAGRGAGKTRAGACWVQHRVESGTMKLGCLIAPTTADIRDVMVEGPSGLLAIAPPWCRPRFESSKRRVQWPNGARAICLSGEEPERARGLNVDTLWADELACWQRAESTWDLAMLALRAGTNPQALITTTPRRVAVLRRILTEASTVQTTETTYANEAHLPPEFLTQIVGLYENTRLGRQEIYAEFLETTEGVWFANFDPARHVSVEAEYHPRYAVHCAIDAGTSRTTAAVFFQVRGSPAGDRPRFTVFGDYLALDVFSQKNARAIQALADQLPCHGHLNRVRLDPAATARSSTRPGRLRRVRAGVRLANPRPVAVSPGHGRARHHRAAPGLRQLDHPPAVPAPEGRVPKLLPQAPPRRVARRAGRWPSGGRPDGRPPRRHSRRLAGLRRGRAQPHSRPCVEAYVMIAPLLPTSFQPRSPKHPRLDPYRLRSARRAHHLGG